MQYSQILFQSQKPEDINMVPGLENIADVEQFSLFLDEENR